MRNAMIVSLSFIICGCYQSKNLVAMYNVPQTGYTIVLYPDSSFWYWGSLEYQYQSWGQWRSISKKKVELTSNFSYDSIPILVKEDRDSNLSNKTLYFINARDSVNYANRKDTQYNILYINDTIELRFYGKYLTIPNSIQIKYFQVGVRGIFHIFKSKNNLSRKYYPLQADNNYFEVFYPYEDIPLWHLEKRIDTVILKKIKKSQKLPEKPYLLNFQ